jgi:SIT4-associating protein SAP185/190
MFWRFGGYANISTVDTLLDKPDVSLEELLDESELISELKQHNTKLIEYLREDHILKRLMDYVIAPPLINEDEDDEGDAEKTVPAESEEGQAKHEDEILEPEDLEKAEKQRLKYSYMACEILSSETWSILESVMLNEAYLRDFWEFVKRPAPLDSLQAGYFTKVNEVLFDKKTEEMLEFFKSLHGIIPAILQHVDNPMVMDLLLKIISLEKLEGGQGIVDVSNEPGFVTYKDADIRYSG